MRFGALSARVRWRAGLLAAMADPGSRVRAVGAFLGRGRPVRAVPGGPATVPLRLKALGGATIHVRPGTSDLAVIGEALLLGYNAPPPEVGPAPACVVEVGTNIGVGLALLAARYPGARLLGVEPDPANAALARVNVAGFGPRVQVVEAAVWDRDGHVSLQREGRAATGYETADEPGPVVARTLDALLADFAPEAGVDYLYLDAEGAHARVLHGADEAGWPGRVRVIKVAGHLGTDYSEPDCARDLERLGFAARRLPAEPTGWIVGVRALQ
jgi:FkbM family methyltransferase